MGCHATGCHQACGRFSDVAALGLAQQRAIARPMGAGEGVNHERGLGMNRRHLLFVATLAVVATPAAAQAPAPSAALAGSATQTSTSIPDFSGFWFHPTSPGFEPPTTGAGPIRNRSRRPDGRGTFNRLVGDYTSPILKPEAAQVVRRHGEISLAGAGYPTPSDQCWPQPVPFIFWTFRTEILQQAHQVTILYSTDHQVRRVRMNAPHPAQVTPSWYGDSVGHYEGDMLVIDTVGVKTDRPFAMVDWFGTPYSPALHVVERYRMIDYEAAKEGWARDAKENSFVPLDIDYAYRGKYLQLSFTVEDDGVFTTPWSATITYWRSVGSWEWEEQACAENIQWYPGQNATVPIADKPDF